MRVRVVTRVVCRHRPALFRACDSFLHPPSTSAAHGVACGVAGGGLVCLMAGGFGREQTCARRTTRNFIRGEEGRVPDLMLLARAAKARAHALARCTTAHRVSAPWAMGRRRRRMRPQPQDSRASQCLVRIDSALLPSLGGRGERCHRDLAMACFPARGWRIASRVLRDALRPGCV